MTEKILVTGGSGQLATALGRLRPEQVVVIGRPAFDFDQPDSIAAAVAAHRPALVINAAAWTAVDGAESDAEVLRAPTTPARPCLPSPAARMVPG